MASTEKIQKLFKSDLKAINMGLSSFADNLKNENTKVVHMAWRPPAGGNKEMGDLLKKLGM
ncbi:MAG: fdrA domain protein [Spirochaetota bacterium]|jgi:hypothetical protein